MKCNNCGAPIQMTQKFCPNCGSPNTEFKKHVEDMERYNKKFNNTRSRVIGNSKWFVRYIAPVTALLISVIALSFAIIGRYEMIGYDIGRKNAQKYYRQHSSEVQSELNELLKNGEYTTLYMLYRDAECSLTDSKDKYAWNDFYNIASYYCDLRKGIISMMEKDNDSYYSNEYLNKIASSASEIEDCYTRCFNTSYHDVYAESEEYIKDMYERSHELLKTYCNLTDEDVSGLNDMSQTEILTLITRRIAQ